MKSFVLKVKHFFKRNIYPITVTMCTVLVLGIIAVSAYSSITKNNNRVVDTNTGIENKDPVIDVGDNDEDKEQKPDNPVSSNDPIIFDLPFENATVSKEYTDSTLLYDETSKLWCTHQGLDFSCVQGQVVKAVYDGTISKVESSMMNGVVVYLKVTDRKSVV